MCYNNDNIVKSEKMKKLKQSEIARLTGFKGGTFGAWDRNEDVTMTFRREALFIGANLLNDGYNLNSSLRLVDEVSELRELNQKLKQEISNKDIAIEELEIAVNNYCDKFEQLKSLRN